jgi:hypothetical protein
MSILKRDNTVDVPVGKVLISHFATGCTMGVNSLLSYLKSKKCKTHFFANVNKPIIHPIATEHTRHYRKKTPILFNQNDPISV